MKESQPIFQSGLKTIMLLGKKWQVTTAGQTSAAQLKTGFPFSHSLFFPNNFISKKKQNKKQ